jgi:2-C-methyl-D-erythritol 4-phosphate cytidylyltransferase
LNAEKENNMAVSAIIVAAGAGTRLGARIPKGFVTLGGRNLFLYSLQTLLAHQSVSNAVLVVPKGFEQKAVRSVHASKFSKKVIVVSGGEKRWQSVERGVRAVESEWVLVHDAARPFVTRAVIDAVLEKKKRYDCVITATPEADTLRLANGELAGETVDRSRLVKVGTPQLFRRSVLLRVFAEAPRLESPPTDEAVLMQRAGVPVALAAGDPANFKITTPADLALAEALIAHRG